MFLDQHGHLATGVADQGHVYADLGPALLVILGAVVGMIVLLTLMAFLEPRKAAATTGPLGSSDLGSQRR